MGKEPLASVVVPRSSEFLPPELDEFLKRDTYSLLIKGDSGTGKTILALTILKTLHPIENLLYLSTRTSPLQLLENYPWVEDIFGPAGTIGANGEKAEGWETLVDARLDEPNVVFERITNVLMDRQAPTVVIDSWESLSDALGSEALRTNIKVLQTWRERAGARFIFIGEDPGNTAIDFMVEGMVVLKDRFEDGQRLRQLTLAKLHGVHIGRPLYFFTLDDGRFRSFPSYSLRDYSFRNPLPVRLDKPFRKAKGRFPTGYEALDRHLDGGYPAKSLALLEVERGIDSRVGLVFVSRTIQDWLFSGDSVLLQRPGDVESRYIRQYSKSFGGGPKGRLSVLGPEQWSTPESSPGRAPKERVRRLAVISARGFAKLRKGGSKGREGPVDGTDLTIVVTRSNEISEEMSRSAMTHIKVTEVEGTLFVQCVVPWSSLFAAVPGRTGGNPMMQLEPVV